MANGLSCFASMTSGSSLRSLGQAGAFIRDTALGKVGVRKCQEVTL